MLFRSLAANDAARIERIWWFGRLIANADMHTGNLSFRPHDTLALAPAYDMLPMHYAPLAGGEVPRRSFEPPLPLPPQRSIWTSACVAAMFFWNRASEDARISEEFRRISASNAQHLKRITDRV